VLSATALLVDFFVFQQHVSQFTGSSAAELLLNLKAVQQQVLNSSVVLNVLNAMMFAHVDAMA
jgi:hypothetical protein